MVDFEIETVGEELEELTETAPGANISMAIKALHELLDTLHLVYEQVEAMGALEKENYRLRAMLTEITDAVDRTVCRAGATPTLVEWCEMIGRARRVLEEAQP